MSGQLGWVGVGLVVGALGRLGPTSADGPKRVDLPPPAVTRVEYERDVKPILAKACYACHGPEKRKSGLRLDRKADALAGGDSGAAIVPGKSAESRLIELVAGVDPEQVMPPKGERLSRDHISVLRAWIDQGAVWPDGALESSQKDVAQTHWAFRAPRRRPPPPVRNVAWVRNPIDAFVLARLESLSVEPSPDAERTTLIRRLSLDLRGLPPTPGELEEFLQDDRADAYEQLVDRLLASPHFGERWGRHWLDLARYADSDGYEKDSPRPYAWRYRNWVIDALNRDLAFDQFTIEQLAGDLLPAATLAQKVATGFHRNTLTNREGGVDQEEFRVKAVVDRVNTTGSVWLGLTVGCAQCHTHKYDPLAHKEYYGLFAFFNTGQEVDVPAPLPGDAEAFAKRKAVHDAEHARLVSALDAFDKDRRPALQTEWEKGFLAAPVSWTVLRPLETSSAAGASINVRDDNSVLVAGINPDVDTYTVKVRTELAGITAFRIEALDDPALPSKGPGRTSHGNFVLTELRVRAEGGDVALMNASADFSQDTFPAPTAIDGDPKTGWAIAPQMGRPHAAVFETREDVGQRGETTLTFVLDQQYGQQHLIGRFRLSATTAKRPITASAIPDDIALILAGSADTRSETQKARLAEYHRTLDPEYRKLAEAVAAHAKKAPKPAPAVVQTLAEKPEPPKTYLLIRGDFLRKGDEVKPGTPAVLHRLTASHEVPTRLDLARWLTDPANPLTARVAVNRLWGHLFGRALSASVEDFGTRGEPPSHPELLDWLATEFPLMEWSQKRMLKLIVESATYRQSSRIRAELADRDPTNVWLARQGRERLEAEVVRDTALATSGLLDNRIGGPSVRPPQPAGIADLTYAGSAKWVDSTGPDRYRRGLYTWFQRTSPYPMLMTFDAPDSNVCVVKRERSNTPLQALTLLNDTVFFECARALGRRIVVEAPGGTEDHLNFAFRLCLARQPAPEESAVLAKLHAEFLTACKAHPAAAEQLVGKDGPAGADIPGTAAWIAMARIILNLDEFVTRQ